MKFKKSHQRKKFFSHTLKTFQKKVETGLENLQENLSEGEKKAILLIIIVITALILGYFWFKSFIYTVSRLTEGIKQQFINIPKELPSFFEVNQNLETENSQREKALDQNQERNTSNQENENNKDNQTQEK